MQRHVVLAGSDIEAPIAISAAASLQTQESVIINIIIITIISSTATQQHVHNA